MVIGPGWPPLISKPPSACSTEPTGVITAAVPQAKTSVSSPVSVFLAHSSVEIRRSVAV